MDLPRLDRRGTVVLFKNAHRRQLVRNIELDVELPDQVPMHRDKEIPHADHKANIESVTAELGRHTGDVGEIKRLKALEILMEKRQGVAIPHGARARRKKGP